MTKKMKKKKTDEEIGCGEELPEDLILEIFTYLPPISLLRFKSVSKTLHSLISNPDLLRRNAVQQFSSRHHPSTPTGCVLLNLEGLGGGSKILMISSPSSPPPLDGALDAGGGGYDYSKLLQHLNDYRPEHDQQQPPDDDKVVIFTVIDSCNGLLLCLHSVIHKNSVNRGAMKRIWYVCNPITKDYIKLPPLLDGEEEEEEIIKFTDAKLVFDPLLSLTGYKVVIWLSEYRAWRLYVYSSETRSWRLSVKTKRTDLTFYLLQRQACYDFRAVLLNGVLYWKTLVGGSHASICYDVEKDSVWTLNYPKLRIPYVDRLLRYFGVCGGGLRLIESCSKSWGWDHSFPFSFNVMEMNQLQLQQQHQDYYLQLQHDHQDYTNIKQQRDLWTVKYRVNIEEEGYYADLFRRKSIFILDLYKTTTKAEGEEGEEMLLCTSNHKVIYFNLSDNIFGKELQNELRLADTKSNLLRYVNITLLPLIH